MSAGTATRLLAIDASSYQPHHLHATERTWTETNCYVDLWIEVLHALGLEPLSAAAFTISTDFEGDQWTFFKFPVEDLRVLFGLEIGEFNVWRPVLDHVVEQLELGRLMIMDADAFFLPDTQGVSYHLAHAKTAMVPNCIDPDGRRLGYFHNAGYFELGGDDFDGLFRLGPHRDEHALPPYVETVRLDRLRRDRDGLVEMAVSLTREHLARRPLDNPMVRFRERIERDLTWLVHQEVETFHLYAFGTCRQCGASSELAGSFVDWLAENDHTLDRAGRDDLIAAADAFREVATTAKALQFSLARASRGRSVDLAAPFEELSQAYRRAMDGVSASYDK